MKDRCLRNEDIEGSKPKSFTKKKLLIKQQQDQASIFTYPYASNIQNNPIGEYVKTENNERNVPTKNSYHFQNNIFGMDLGFYKQSKNQNDNFPIDNNRTKNYKNLQEVDSLDKFQKDFGMKNFDFPKLNENPNFLDVFNIILDS